MSKIEAIYKSILDFADCTVNSAGYIQLKGGRENSNIIIDGKDLVFPTNEQLRNPQPNTIIFHPLSENEIGGEPPVVARLRELIFLKFNKVTACLMQDLISVINSTELHKNLSKEAQELLYKGIAVNAGSIKALGVLHKAEASNFAKMYVSGWLRKGGSVRGRSYSRAGIVNFQLYNKLSEEGFLEELPKGMRKDDPENFKKLMEYIFPNIEKPGEYYEGSDSRVAPFFDALLKTVKGIADQIQTVLDNFREQLVISAEYDFNSEWMPEVNDLDALRGQIAMIPVSYSGVAQEVQQQTTAAVGNPSAMDLIKALSGQPGMPAQQPKLEPGKRRSLTELANTNPHFGMNVLMENNKTTNLNTNHALQALMSGNGNNNSAAIVMQMLQQQGQTKDRLVSQYGAQRATAILQMMQTGASEQTATMQVLANTPKEPDINQILMQALAAQQQGAQMGNGNSNMALLAALVGQQNNQQVNIPQGYPQGQVVNIGGRNFLKFMTQSGEQIVPLP